MIIQRLFSKKSSYNKYIPDKTTALGGSVVVGSSLLGKELYKQSMKDEDFFQNKKSQAHNLNKELEKEATRLGVKIDRTSKDISKPKKTGNKFIDKLLDKKYKNKVKLINSPRYSPIFNKISMGKDNISPISLSHELGHVYYESPGWKGKRIGKAAHKVYTGTGGNFNPLFQTISSVYAGKRSGRAKAREEVTGEKQGKLSKNSHLIAPTVLSIPVLMSEGLASKRGISLLKRSGASKEVLRNARKSLSAAWGTYAAKTASSIGIGTLAKNRSYRKEKKKLLNKK